MGSLDHIFASYSDNTHWHLTNFRTSYRVAAFNFSRRSLGVGYYLLMLNRATRFAFHDVGVSPTFVRTCHSAFD